MNNLETTSLPAVLGTNKDLSRLRTWLVSVLPDDYDKYDLNAKYDDTLTFDENKTLIEAEIAPLIEHSLTRAEIKANQDRDQATKYKAQLQGNASIQHDWVTKKLNSSNLYGILGGRGTGKTALGYHWLELHNAAGRPCFAVNFPNVNDLPSWVNRVTSIEAVPRHGVALIDEAGITFNQYSNAKNSTRELSDLLKTARQKKISVIFISQHGGFFTKDIVRLVDTLFLRPPSLTQIYEERGMIKELYKICAPMFKDSNHAKTSGYYVADNDLQEMLYYDLPTFWTTAISEAYGQEQTTTITNTSALLRLWQGIKNEWNQLQTGEAYK